MMPSIMAAKPLILQFEGTDIPCHLSKIDRSKLYGYVEKEVRDENDDPCDLVTLAADGQTLIGSGGSTFAYFSPDGLWCEKSDLRAVNLENEPVTPVTSSFKDPIPLLERASIEDYLSHNIRSAYLLETEDGFPDGLKAALNDGSIYTFPFSYRGGLDPDVAFLLAGTDGVIWMVLGKPTTIGYVGLSESGPAVSDDDADSGHDIDLMDFGLM